MIQLPWPQAASGVYHEFGHLSLAWWTRKIMSPSVQNLQDHDLHNSKRRDASLAPSRSLSREGLHHLSFASEHLFLQLPGQQGGYDTVS